MRALLRAGTLAVLVGLTSAGVACNAVLGIEQAELDQDSAATATCSWPAADPTVECQVCDDQCQTHCSVQQCLGNQSCRIALKDFRKCAGNACSDPAGNCGGCTAKNGLSAQVTSCLAKDYNLPATAAASLCASYCACLHDRCPDDETAMKPEACEDVCLKGSAGDPGGFGFWNKAVPTPSQVYCLWGHCEMAVEPNDGFHCLHALGKDAADKCPASRAIAPNAVACEYPKGYAFAPCNDDGDCCGTCRQDTGLCQGP